MLFWLDLDEVIHRINVLGLFKRFACWPTDMSVAPGAQCCAMPGTRASEQAARAFQLLLLRSFQESFFEHLFRKPPKPQRKQMVDTNGERNMGNPSSTLQRLLTSKPPKEILKAVVGACWFLFERCLFFRQRCPFPDDQDASVESAP